MKALEQALTAHGKAVILEAPGGYGKTRLVFELAASGDSATPWFFVDAALPFGLEYLAEAEDGYEVTIFVDDAHRRTDLEALVGALERRQPTPRLVFAIRPGHASAVESALHGLALPEPSRFRLGLLGRSDLAAILKNEPFKIERDAMLARIIGLSEGNAGVAVLAGALAAEGTDPGDLSRADVFRRHVDSRLQGARLDSRENRELLALVAAVAELDTTDAQDVAAAQQLIGVNQAELRRRLDGFADAGLVVEESAQRYAIKPDIVREHVQRFSFFPETGQPVLRYENVYELFGHRLESLLSGLGESGAETARSAEPSLALVRRELHQRLTSAQSADDLVDLAALTRRLGAGGSAVAVDVARGLIERVDELVDSDVDRLVPGLVEVLSVAKFGRDRFPEAWALLLRLARRVLARPGAADAREAVKAEITSIFDSAPMNYSSRDYEVLGYMQDVVRRRSLDWWRDE